MPGQDFDGIEVDVRREGSVVVVSAVGTIDLLTAPALTHALETALADGPPALLVDLLKVEFLASPGLKTLIQLHLAAEDRTVLAVVADAPATRRPLTVSGIDQMIALYSTLDEALEQLSK